jgi:type I restriction enzyme S subunit
LTALRSGTVDLKQCKEGDWTADEAASFIVSTGDFLVARGNGSLRLVGRGGLVGDVKTPVAFPDTLIRVRPRADICDNEYLRLVWDSTCVRRQIEAAARTTAGIYKINQRDLSSVQVPIPSLRAQAEITQHVGELWSRIDAATAGLVQLRFRIAALRRSLLAAAASGRLSPPEPTAETATELLGRVAEARLALAATARRRPRRTVPGGTSEPQNQEIA